jgi:hypothetical protein
MTSIEEFKAKYADWVATVKSQPTMLNFPSIDNNLMPLWELTGESKDYSDPNNQHGYGHIALAMYNCFLDLAHEQQGLLEQYDYSMTSDKTDYVMTDIGVWGSGTSEGALHEISSQGYEVVRLNPDGHGRYEIDANKGAGGDYLYIAYRMEKFRENGIVKQDVLDRAIVDIAITIGENSSKTNYEKVNVD